MTEPASAPTSADLVDAFGDACFFYHENAEMVGFTKRTLLARLAAYDALAAAARIEVARSDRFGCRELRDALAELDEGIGQ